MLKAEYLKKIPSVDEILKFPDICSLSKNYSRTLLVKGIREVLIELRREMTADESNMSGSEIRAEIEKRTKKKVIQNKTMGIQKVINAAGIILHTGFGRAVLAPKAIEALSKLTGYCNLQVDRETGERSLREKNIEKLLHEITGAESATVVNNNAAATMLVLNTLAKNKEVIVSRGQLVEIGGSFRLPDVMESSGAVLKEVGTTNRTHLADYERAVSQQTGLLLHVHTSNYQIKGFTSEVPVQDLVKLGKKYQLPVVDDIGSGALVTSLKTDNGTFELLEEPQVQTSLAQGADIVTFSADKLVGGPQGGIILGKVEFIEKIRKNPLARALRVGKLTLTALEATLQLFLDENNLSASLPTFRILTQNVISLEKRAISLARQIEKIVSKSELAVEIKDDFSQMGSGSLPNEDIPTKALSLKASKISAQELAKKLRAGNPPVFVRIKDDSVLLDLRTILDGEEKEVVDVLHNIFL